MKNLTKEQRSVIIESIEKSLENGYYPMVWFHKDDIKLLYENEERELDIDVDNIPEDTIYQMAQELGAKMNLDDFWEGLKELVWQCVEEGLIEKTL